MNRESEELTQAVELILERHRASLSVSEVATLEEVLRHLEDLQSQSHVLDHVEMTFKAAKVVAKILEFLDVID